MRVTLKVSALGAAVALTAVALTSCSTSGAAPSAKPTTSASPTSIATLKQKAQGEHGLVIYANAPQQYFQPVIAAFNKQYPGIKVTETVLSDNTVFSKYEAEAAQGARTADMLVASAPASWVQAEQNGVSANVTPTGLSAFPSWVDQGQGVYVMSAEPVLLAYSPRLLKPSEVPTTYAQLAADTKADPAKYKLVSYPIDNPLNYGGIYGLIHILGADKVWSYYDTMGPHTKTFNEGLDALTQILQGGASVGYMTSGLSQGVLPHYKGLADYTFMKDATPLIPRAITVSKNASSPASAQLFLDFLYTQGGQDALCAGGFEATMTNYQTTNGCTASLAALDKKVPASSTYLVPINQTVLDQQSTITKRWNQSFHR
jgi:iron(III) transport system substrate-binding protein